MKWWTAVTVVAISSQKALLMCPYISFSKFLVLAPRCSRARHIDIRKYYVSELVLAVFLKLVPLRTHKMVADTLTKGLPSPAFVGHRQIMTGHAFFAACLLRCVGG